jgi:uncharacterized protein YsxB (DUF464 family)
MEIHQFIMEGHADYGSKGNDVVCASVSAITGAAIVGIERLLDLQPTIEVDEKRGYLNCVMPQHLSREWREKANVILETMVLGIKDIATQSEYAKYIEVIDKEV